MNMLGRSSVCGSMVGGALVLLGLPAFAEEPVTAVAAPVAESAPAATPTLSAPPATLAVVTRPLPATTTMVAAVDTAADMEAEPTISASAPPPTDFLKSFNAAIWMRVGGRLQGTQNPESLNDFGAERFEVDALFGGAMNEYVKWQANFVATLGDERKASILDLIAKFEFHDLANVWFGRMLVPSDRSNFSGAWFMSAWNYPGVYGGTFVGPKTGPFGRDEGATFWGQLLGGYIKYYAGAYNLQDSGVSPLFSGRLNVSLLNPEPGYFHSSTYYGGKDIVALGLGVQSQKNGSSISDSTGMLLDTGDLTMVSVDLLAEKKLGDAGTATFEAAYYQFDDLQPAKRHFFVLGSYLLPWKVGIGYLQPLARLQVAEANGSDDTWTLADGFLSYVVDRYAMRVAAGYQYSDLGGLRGNAIQVGVQIMR